MQLGDLDYLNRVKSSADPHEAEDAQTVDALELSQRQIRVQKRKNWWYYNKWYVICGVVLLGIIIHVAGNGLGWWTKIPDLQIAYIGKTELPSEALSELEDVFSRLADDFNGDGEVIIRINQYLSGFQSFDPDILQYQYASEITLIGDISDCESYFFLMDDPAQFQRSFQLLAAVDGSCPDDEDYSVEDKVIMWSDCPLLAEADTGNNQELLAGLFIGRRCFPTDDRTDYADECGELWDMLYKERPADAAAQEQIK